MATKGNKVALRVVPPARSGIAIIELPKIAKPADVAEAADGDRGPRLADASRSARVHGAARRQSATLETQDLAPRLELLEEQDRQRSDRHGVKR